jgi:urea carboxylase
VWLPLSWDDPATRVAIEKYMQSVRKDAPWCPSNIEFIRRINGLDSIAEVYRTVFEASYLVLGLGDVYLGAPVATPVDPRHRLVTTKYNPARTWTPENAVGIGGAYMCVYGMEGPGGYQFVGRTVQMWNRWRQTAQFSKPWLLRFFDQVRFTPVSEAELLQLRKDFIVGRAEPKIEEGVFRLADYRRFLAEHAESISAFKAGQQSAFEAERERWRAAGQAEYISEAEESASGVEGQLELPEGARVVTSHVPGNVWKVMVEPGQAVKAGDPLVIVESRMVWCCNCCAVKPVPYPPGRICSCCRQNEECQHEPHPSRPAIPCRCLPWRPQPCRLLPDASGACPAGFASGLDQHFAGGACSGSGPGS